MQEESLKDLKTFVIIDDLLATGGTLGSVAKILISNGKIILGAAAVIELRNYLIEITLIFQYSLKWFFR